jgi:hypothetical protein
MPLRAVIPAAVAATQNYESARLQEEWYYPSYSASSSGVGFGMPREQGLPSYGSTASSNAFTSSDGAGARLGGGDVDGPDEGDGEVEGEVEETPFEEEEEELEVVYQPEQIDGEAFTWRDHADGQSLGGTCRDYISSCRSSLYCGRLCSSCWSRLHGMSA